MQVLVTRDHFFKNCYELQTGDAALEFISENDAFALPYTDIKELSIAEDIRGKVYFTVFCSDGMFEGQLSDTYDLGMFVSTLQDKMHGVIQIEIKK